MLNVSTIFQFFLVMCTETSSTVPKIQIKSRCIFFLSKSKGKEAAKHLVVVFVHFQRHMSHSQTCPCVSFNLLFKHFFSTKCSIIQDFYCLRAYRYICCQAPFLWSRTVNILLFKGKFKGPKYINTYTFCMAKILMISAFKSNFGHINTNSVVVSSGGGIATTYSIITTDVMVKM